MPQRDASNEYHNICFCGEMRKISVVFWLKNINSFWLKEITLSGAVHRYLIKVVISVFLFLLHQEVLLFYSDVLFSR